MLTSFAFFGVVPTDEVLVFDVELSDIARNFDQLATYLHFLTMG